jgi:hypothetical protein
VSNFIGFSTPISPNSRFPASDKMSSLLAYPRFSGNIKHGVQFYRTHSATKLTSCFFPAAQTRSFRSVARQLGQAGLAGAREPAYFPEHIIQELPQDITHRPVTPKSSAQIVDDTLKRSSVTTLQEIKMPLIETALPESPLETTTVPAYHRGTQFDRDLYWQRIGRWKDVTEKQFLSYRWGVS